MNDRARFVVIAVAGTVLGAVLSALLGLSLDNDTYARLTRAAASPTFLPLTHTKPLEMGLARSATLAGDAAPAIWKLLGAIHFGLALALVEFLVRRTFGPSAALIALALFLLNALIIENFLTLNSTATLATAALGWSATTLANRRRLALVALAAIALSRLDGMALALLLAPGACLIEGPDVRRQRLFERVLVVGAAVILWLAVDRVANGQWLGFIEAQREFMASAPHLRLGPLWALRVLRGYWLDYGSEVFLVLVVLGAVLSVRGPLRGLQPALLVLGVHQVVVAVIGVTGNAVPERFVLPDLVLGCASAGAALVWIFRALPLPEDARARGGLLAALGVVALLGYLGQLRGLETRVNASRHRESDARVLVGCFAELRAHLPAAHRLALVAPSSLIGPLAWHLRQVPLGALHYERQLDAEWPERLQILWIRGPASPDLPVPLIERPVQILSCPGESRGYRLYLTDPASS